MILNTFCILSCAITNNWLSNKMQCCQHFIILLMKPKEKRLFPIWPSMLYYPPVSVQLNILWKLGNHYMNLHPISMSIKLSSLYRYFLQRQKNLHSMMGQSPCDDDPSCLGDVYPSGICYWCPMYLLHLV